MNVERRWKRLVLMGSLSLIFSFGSLYAGGGGGSGETGCGYFQDWSEDDQWPLSDDPAHTGDLEFDPNAEWPAEEWYRKELLTRAIPDNDPDEPHLSFERGSFAEEHHPSGCDI